MEKRQLNLEDAAALAGWHTPEATDAPCSRSHCVNVIPGLGNQARGALAGWITPGATDDRATSGGRGREKNPSLRVMAGWVSPTAKDGLRGKEPPRPWDTGVPLSQQVAGAISNLSPAGTAKRGALNPAHSAWLMGYPMEWQIAGMKAMKQLKRK